VIGFHTIKAQWILIWFVLGQILNPHFDLARTPSSLGEIDSNDLIVLFIRSHTVWHSGSKELNEFAVVSEGHLHTLAVGEQLDQIESCFSDEVTGRQ
jgi:hypothetical protein